MKKKVMKKVILIALVLWVSAGIIGQVKASFISGGEITWTWVGNDSILVKLSLYRDCNSGNYTSPALQVRCAATGQSISTKNATLPSPLSVTPVCAGSCNTCQSSSCTFPYGIEKYDIYYLVDMKNAGTCCELVLSSGQCCRGFGITTIGNSQGLHIDAKLNRCIGENSSPQFTYDPVNIICVGSDQVLNAGAISTDKDSDGKFIDSLSFEICPPLSSSTSPVAYIGSYAYDKPIYFWGFPNGAIAMPRGFHVSAINGDIAFRPMKVEQTIMCIKVTEYRKVNGVRVKVSEVKRDLHIIVINCSNTNPPMLIADQYYKFHAGRKIELEIKSQDNDASDSIILKYNNELPGAQWSINNNLVKHPVLKINWNPDIKYADNRFHFYVQANDQRCPLNETSTEGYVIDLIKPLAVSLGNDIHLCTNQTKKLVPVFENAIGQPTYLWSNGSTNQYLNVGPITNDTVIWVRVIDAVKDTAYDSINIFYNNFKIQFSQDVVVCPGIASTLIVHPILDNGTAISAINWYRHSCNCHSGSNDSLIVYSPTLYRCEVTDNLGCKVSDTVTAVYHPVPIINLSYIAPICENTGNFDLVPYGKPTPGIWYAQNPELVKNNYFLTKDAGPGQYLLSYVYTDSSTFCSSTEKIVIEVKKAPTVSLNSYDSICESYGPYLLTASPVNGVWTGNGVEKTSDWYFNPAKVSITNVGSFDLTYKFTDSNNCSDEGIFKLTVFENKEVNAGDSDIVCMYESPVVLQPYPSGGIWSGNGLEGNTFNPAKAGNGLHVLYYSYTNGLCSSTDSVKYYVPEVPDSTLSKNNDSLFAVAGMQYYQWYLNGNSLNGENKAYIVCSQNGIYHAYYTDKYGCSFQSKKLSFASMRNSFENQITIYPNPVKNKLFVNSILTEGNVELYDINGKLLLSSDFEAGIAEIDMSLFASGIYYLNINSDAFNAKYLIFKQ